MSLKNKTPPSKEIKKKKHVTHVSIFLFEVSCYPCCVSVRIQMVLVAPVRTSSSTNQIHVTHTEDRKEEIRGRRRGNPKEVGKIDTAGLPFPDLFFPPIYSADAKPHNITIKSV